MKIKWVELTEDDPIFKKGLLYPIPKSNQFKTRKKQAKK